LVIGNWERVISDQLSVMIKEILWIG